MPSSSLLGERDGQTGEPAVGRARIFAVCEERDVDYATLTENRDYVDQISGEPLPHDLVQKGRQLELENMQKHQVFRWVPESEATKRPVKTRIIDSLKQPGLVRSRLVAQQFKFMNCREDCYAGTPPAFAINMIISRASRACTP